MESSSESRVNKVAPRPKPAVRAQELLANANETGTLWRLRIAERSGPFPEIIIETRAPLTPYLIEQVSKEWTGAAWLHKGVLRSIDGDTGTAYQEQALAALDAGQFIIITGIGRVEE